MSAGSNPDFASEVRDIEKRVRQVRSSVIHKLSERLRDPSISEVQRVELEKRLQQTREPLPPDSDDQT